MRIYPPIQEASGRIELVALVRSTGFAILRGGGATALEHALRELGEVLFIEEVKTGDSSRSLVTSDRALPPHTDHHRARWIVWICAQQAERGGDSLVIDGLDVLALLTSEQQEVLTRIQLIEHSVFAGDVDTSSRRTNPPVLQLLARRRHDARRRTGSIRCLHGRRKHRHAALSRRRGSARL